ncbi:MAG: S1 RNA-binding domain-containing protein [Lachnospiraceae bacterium]|nr:S1 RNA-binding domain-containing protein [Lachnospiraceae bacterium]MBP5275501.1 S1 RNA-binding domain-containing protein [Lachnospiraceae bacterium]MBP5565749.1 S1 RNA-binding domain-containing protein [Lachnospiraceae bacterium]
MLRTGEKQELTAVKAVDFGMYFSEEGDDTKVLLPKKEVPTDFKIGDKLELFLYRDSQDRLIATVRNPKIMVNETAVLRVKNVTKIGAFLDWGLEKDLFLPFKEQTTKLFENAEILVGMYVDKSDRLCATMKVYKYLKSDSPYQKDDWVKARVYEISDRFGAYAAVDDKYSALIPTKEMTRDIRLNDVIEARVTGVLEDGRLNLSVRDKAYLMIDKDADYIKYLINSYDGVLPFNDKASPEVIKRECNMSKNEFKRAVGHLLKKGEIVIGEKVIYSKERANK